MSSLQPLTTLWYKTTSLHFSINLAIIDIHFTQFKKAFYYIIGANAKIELDRACRKNFRWKLVNTKDLCCRLCCLLWWLIDEVTEIARKGWMKLILYADLMGKLWTNWERTLMNGERRLKAKRWESILERRSWWWVGWRKKRSTVRLILVACVERELCLTRCYVQHVVSRSTQDARIRRKLQFIWIKILFVRNVEAWWRTLRN